jgi:outer membrane protein assembly factor BamA
MEPLRKRRRQTAPVLAVFVGLGVATSVGCAPKGPHYPWIHKVYFHGVKQLKDKEVRPKVAVQQSSWFPLTPKRYLENPMSVEFDRERITTYYQTRGFFATSVPQAEIKNYKLDPKKDPATPESVKAVDVHYTIEEGLPVTLTAIQIAGLDGIPADDARYARREVRVRTGERFEHVPYLETKELLLLQLRKRGYAFAKLASSEVTVDRDARTAQVHIVVVPGRKALIGEVTIQGTQKVDAVALKKHAAVPTGQGYKPQALDEVQGRLYSLGLFSTVLVEPVENPQNPEIADVRITVKEGKHRELRLGFGFGIEPLRNDVHGELLYTQRRFFGGLRVFQFTGQAGYAALPAVWADPLRRHGPILLGKGDLTQPDILGKSSALTASVSYEVGVQYAYQYHGPSFRLGLTKGLWRNRISLAASYNFQFLDFFEAEAGLDGKGDTSVLFGFSDPYRLGFLQEQAALDLRNRPIDATRGFYLSMLAEQGGNYTGGAFSYQKFQPEVRAYYTLWNRLTIAARVQFGHIFAQGDLGSPITQRFYLGGPNSHRGFSFNRLSYQMCSGSFDAGMGPVPVLVPCRDPRTDAKDGNGNPVFQRLPTGGDTMLLGQLELRLGLFRLARQWVTLASFVDAGDVAPPSAVCAKGGCNEGGGGLNLDLTKLHVAVGGGLRYRTVIGTIRFDLGVRLNRLEKLEGNLENPDPDQRIAYHISIGESF